MQGEAMRKYSWGDAGVDWPQGEETLRDSIKSANLKRHQKALKRTRCMKLFFIFPMECKTKNERLNWSYGEGSDQAIQEQLETGTQEALKLLLDSFETGS